MVLEFYIGGKQLGCDFDCTLASRRMGRSLGPTPVGWTGASEAAAAIPCDSAVLPSLHPGTITFCQRAKAFSSF